MVTVTVGCGTGTLTVTVGAGFGSCCRLVAPRTAGTVIATISASPLAAASASKALDRSRIRSFLRCLLPGRGSRWVITPLMVDPGAARHLEWTGEVITQSDGRTGRNTLRAADRGSAGAAALRLAALLDPGFLAAAGWDPVTRVLAPPAAVNLRRSADWPDRAGRDGRDRDRSTDGLGRPEFRVGGGRGARRTRRRAPVVGYAGERRSPARSPRQAR